MTQQQIAREIEAIGLELIEIRQRLNDLGHVCHRQGLPKLCGQIADQTAWDTYLAISDKAPGLYSRGHFFKRLGRKLQLEGIGRQPNPEAQR